MSLLKLSNNHKVDFDPIQKSVAKVENFKNLNLIQSAYLFGSGATNTMTADSDLDLLLVFKNEDELKIAKTEIIHSTQTIAIDWIFKLADEFEVRKNMGGVCFEAFHYGKKMK